MANPVFVTPNHLDGDFYSVVLGGGAWASTLPLTNLQTDPLSEVARSSSAAAADTLFFLDLGASVSVTSIAISSHNLSLDGQYRIRGSNTPKWSGATLNSSAAGGASSISVLAGATTVTIAAGEIFTIAGDSTVYKATSSATIAPAANASINISPNKVGTTASGAVTAHSGDFTTPVYDSGTLDAFAAIYPFGSLPWGHPSWWNGKPTEAQRRLEKWPIIKHFSSVIARYWKYEFTDTSNADGYVELSRLFMALGYQPSLGVPYGAQQGIETDTTVTKALNGRKLYYRQPSRRTWAFELRDLPTDEALARAYDMMREIGIDKQFFFIFDPDATAHLHRCSFTATIARPDALSYPYYNSMNVAYFIEEVVA